MAYCTTDSSSTSVLMHKDVTLNGIAFIKLSWYDNRVSELVPSSYCERGVPAPRIPLERAYDPASVIHTVAKIASN